MDFTSNLHRTWAFIAELAFAALPLAVSWAAETTAFQCQETVTLKAAKPLMERVQKEYAKVDTLQAVFVQSSRLAALESLEHSSGAVWFVKPGKMKWHYESPEEQDFILKDQTSWFYQPALTQVVIDEISDVFISDLPISFLMGIGDLAADFELKSACRTSHGVKLELSAKSGKINADQELKGFALLVNSSAGLPRGAQVTDVAENVTTIVLNDVKTNVTVSEAVFATDFPKGTDKLDRRVVIQ